MKNHYNLIFPDQFNAQHDTEIIKKLTLTVAACGLKVHSHVLKSEVSNPWRALWHMFYTTAIEQIPIKI